MVTEILSDAPGIVSLDTWNATDTSLLSYAKTPLQQTFFANNSDLIGKALRQSIIYFTETLNSIDRTSCLVGDEFRTKRTLKYSVPRSSDERDSEASNLEVTVFAPIAFEYVRTVLGITRNDFYSSFNMAELINFANTGRSGSQMYKTLDDTYIIKTLRDHEAKLLIKALPGLYLRYTHNCSLMTRYVGLYSVKRPGIASEVFCVIMLNNLPSFLEVEEIFDLKGSSVGRYSSIDLPDQRLKALKDLDFQSFYPYGIRLPHNIYRRLRQTLESDIFELKKLMITDFSLMLGIHHLDKSSFQTNVDGKKCFELKPQLGISSLFAATNVDRSAVVLSIGNESNGKMHNIPKEKLMQRFVMKPLQVITWSHDDTFEDSLIAKSGLGIPGVTHDGRRVLLYPAFIDCLQAFDNFKQMQNWIQNLRDSKRGSEYSVVHPDEYEKRLLKFLFEKVFIDSQQTLPELLMTPHITGNPLEPNTPQNTSFPHRESYEILENINGDQMVIRTTEVLQDLSIETSMSLNQDQPLIQSTML